MRSDTKHTIAIVLAMVLFIAVPNFFVLRSWQSCEANGGTFVKTVLWYKCLDTKR